MSIEGGSSTDRANDLQPGGRVEAFIPGGRETDFDYPTAATPGREPTYDTTMESGPPGEPTTTDDAATPGSDPALSGYPADPGAAPLGQPAEGQPGKPGTTPGAPPPGAARPLFRKPRSVTLPMPRPMPP